jgi:CO dehydrogenase maturation factor
MSFLIGISGKGGVGKTTISALIVRQLVARGCAPVLALDADPNSCLDAALGMQVIKSIGSVREETRQIAGKGGLAGIAKQELLELKISQSLVEGENFDLIAMGRPEGPGCYCFANNVLKETIAGMSASYPYVVLDNEAGLENVSRRIVQRLNLLVMVSDPSKKGLETLERLHALATEMEIKYDRLAVIVNRLVNGTYSDIAQETSKKIGADILIGLPENGEISSFMENGRSLSEISATNPVKKGIDHLLEKTGLNQKADKKLP